MNDNRFWWLQPEHASARFTAHVSQRPDDHRCHNIAHMDGLCKLHMRLAGIPLPGKPCPTCGRMTKRVRHQP
jgi:hypothetical protein